MIGGRLRFNPNQPFHGAVEQLALSDRTREVFRLQRTSKALREKIPSLFHCDRHGAGGRQTLRTRRSLRTDQATRTASTNRTGRTSGASVALVTFVALRAVRNEVQMAVGVDEDGAATGIRDGMQDLGRRGGGGSSGRRGGNRSRQVVDDHRGRRGGRGGGGGGGGRRRCRRRGQVVGQPDGARQQDQTAQDAERPDRPTVRHRRRGGRNALRALGRFVIRETDPEAVHVRHVQLAVAHDVTRIATAEVGVGDQGTGKLCHDLLPCCTQLLRVRRCDSLPFVLQYFPSTTLSRMGRTPVVACAQHKGSFDPTNQQLLNAPLLPRQGVLFSGLSTWGTPHSTSRHEPFVRESVYICI